LEKLAQVLRGVDSHCIVVNTSSTPFLTHVEVKLSDNAVTLEYAKEDYLYRV